MATETATERCKCSHPFQCECQQYIRKLMIADIAENLHGATVTCVTECGNEQTYTSTNSHSIFVYRTYNYL